MIEKCYDEKLHDWLKNVTPALEILPNMTIRNSEKRKSITFVMNIETENFNSIILKKAAAWILLFF